MIDNIDPCELALTTHYKNKNTTQIKSSLYYIRQVAENITDRGVLRGFIDTFAKQRGIELGTKLLSELDTLGKYAMNMDRISNPKWNGDYTQAALSLYEESTSVVKGAGLNAEGATQVKQKAFWGAFNRDIEAIGFAKEFRSGAFDKEIRQVIFSGKQYEGPGAKEINQTASILRKYYSIMNKELNSAGLRVAYRANYDGPMVHDGSAIYGKFTEWARSLDKNLDLHKEYPEIPTEEITAFQAMIKSGIDLPSKPTNELHKVLNYSYKNITETESMLHDDMPLSIQRPVSIAERRSYAKTFTTWKSGEAIQDYLNEFGKYKTMAEQMQNYTRMAAKDIGLVSVFGATPSKGHAMIKTLVERKMRLEGKTEFDVKDMQKTLDIAYNNLVRPKVPPPTPVGGFLMNVRTLSAQAKLGTAGITSIIMDPNATIVQHRNIMQEGLISSIYNTAKFYIPSMYEAATKGGNSLADAYLFSTHDIITSQEEYQMMNGGSKLTNALRTSGEFISKASGAYYFNKVAAITNAKMYLTFLADAANGKNINPIMMADLQKFNITQHDINITAKLGLNTESGMRNIFRMDVNEYMQLNPDITDPIKAEHLLSSYKERMSEWLLHKIKGGAPIPGNRERRILLGDTIPGTIEGEARRYLMQFKATQTKVFLDTTIGATRRLTPDAMQGGKADWTNKQSMYNLGTVAAAFTMAGASNMIINAVLTGDEKQLKRWEDKDPALLPEAFARGGAAGVLGDLLSWKSNKAELGAQILMSPATSAVLTPFVAAETATTGGKPAKAALDIGKAFIPGANLWFLKPFVQGMTDAASNSKIHHSKTDNRKL